MARVHTLLEAVLARQKHYARPKMHLGCIVGVSLMHLCLPL
jgi:hypothetical protein